MSRCLEWVRDLLFIVILLGCPWPPGGSGGPLLAASVEGVLPVDGAERRYRSFIPPGLPPGAPLILAFHGGGGSAEQMERHTGLSQLAVREGFAVIYPEAEGGNWNDGRGVEFLHAHRENIDDVKFARMLVEDAVSRHGLDHRRVFATGISNGAFLCHRLAAEAADWFAGIAPVAGGMAPAVAEEFRPSAPVSVLLIQGDVDPLVPINGGEVGFHGRGGRGGVVAARRTISIYVQRNRPRGEPTIQTWDRVLEDGTIVEAMRYPDGEQGVKMAVYWIKGGGHAWPGRPPHLSRNLIGRTCQEFSASEAIVEFFLSCPPR